METSSSASTSVIPTSSESDVPLASIVESLVFSAGKPMTLTRLADATNSKTEEIEAVLAALQQEYQEMRRGIRLVQSGRTVQMVTAPENAATVAKLLGKELTEKLSDVALETLAIIAYRGPIRRSAIEAIRGVNCVYILRNLLLRGLVEKRASKEGGVHADYEVSLAFLRHLGLNSVRDLPDFEPMSRGLAAVEQGTAVSGPVSVS